MRGKERGNDGMRSERPDQHSKREARLAAREAVRQSQQIVRRALSPWMFVGGDRQGCQQGGPFDRFCDDRVHPVSDTLIVLSLRGVSSQGDYWCPGEAPPLLVFPDLAHRLQSVHHRHLDIH